MGIFDIFTNDAAEEAAAKNAQLYQGYGQQAGNALNNYATSGDQYLTNYGGAAQGALQQGFTGAQPAAQNAIDAYTPLSALGQKYGRATDLYQDALGVNGGEGAARAQAAFHTGPGYQFAVDEGTRAAANKASSLGIAGSGNTLDAIRARAQGFANQEYGGYLDRLAGFVNPELQATSGAAAGTAGGYRNLSDLYSQYGAGQAGLLSGLGQARTSLAGNVAQGQVGVAGNVTSGLAGANNQVAQGAQAGSATFWNGLAQIGSAAAKAAAGGGMPR